MAQNRTDEQYADQIQSIMRKGNNKGDRTGTGTISQFALLSRYDNKHGRVLPVVSGKKTNIDAIIKENLWFVAGNSNIKQLVDGGVKIWNEWADENGDLGPVYPTQWRKREDIKIVGAGDDDRIQVMHDRGYTYQGILMKQDAAGFSKGGVFPTIWKREIDQLANAIERLKTHPECRRIIVDAWNPADLEDMKLPPCHMSFIFNTHELDITERQELYIDCMIADVIGALNFKCTGLETDYEIKMQAREILLSEIYDSESTGETETQEEMIHRFFDTNKVPSRGLDCAMVQRSADFFLGVPFNVTGYCIILHMVAKLVGMVPNELAHFTVDSHIYQNHTEQALKYLNQVDERVYDEATLKINGKQETIDDFTLEDFEYTYDHGAYIKAPVAV